MRFLDRDAVARRLTYERCMPVVREAMIALSGSATKQVPRAIIPLAETRMFGVMAGALSETGPFGAKLISVSPNNFSKGLQSHQGVVVLFDPATGAPVCVAHAGEVTAIRTASASAVATDALARPGAAQLAILGYGEQARCHARAIAKVRTLAAIRVWGRTFDRARAFAERMQLELSIPVTACAAAQDAVEPADIICTVTAAAEPILKGAWVAPGAHVNVVGSSYAGPVEIDNELVARARFFADSRANVLQQGAEFLKAKEAGLIGDGHIVGEIGEVLAGKMKGRISETDVTIYKSLGHIVQDLAAVSAIFADDA